jgi:hypothetical protein
MIPIDRPFVPRTQENNQFSDSRWQHAPFTGKAPIARKLNAVLLDKLGAPNLGYKWSGNLVLRITTKAFQKLNKIITMFFNYVTTSLSIVWENCHPIYRYYDDQVTILFFVK